MKKIIIIFLLGIFVVFKLHSQPWMNLLPKDKKQNEFSFYEIKKVFDEYWKGKKIERGKGWKQFKRWEWFAEPRAYPSGFINANKILLNELISKKSVKADNGNWTVMGPYQTPVELTNPGYRRGSGRINCIAFHPTNPDIFWVGAPAGGFWKTTTGGNSWTTTTDNLLSIGVSDIAVNPLNPQCIFIATGDGDAWDTYSIGILKSIDGGQSWNPTGIVFNLDQNVYFRKLIMNPIDSNILIATSSIGIYRTADNGQSWTNVMPGNFKDLVYKPNNSNIVYATSYDRSGGAAIFISNDGGATWGEANSGILSADVNRISLAVTLANSNFVYALCSNTSGSGFHSIYKSVDSGNNWNIVNQNQNINLMGWSSTGDDTGGQGWYDLSIAVDPSNENTIYVGGVNIWKSTDGGSSWNINAHWYGDNGVAYVHADQHIFSFNSLNNNLYSGNDGGLHKTIDGTNWIDLSDYLTILQIYRIGTSATNPEVVITGSQDNGSMKRDNTDWFAVLGGDGMDCMVDFTDENIFYVEYYYGNMYRTDDGGYTVYPIRPPGAPDGAWITPYIMHPTQSNIIFSGYNEVYKSEDRGNTWSVISQGMTEGENLKTLAISVSNNNYLYAATSNRIWKTTNGGISWTEITTGLPFQSITGITISSSNPENIWVSLSGYVDGEKVFQSTDGGLSWQNFSTGLPNVPANCIVYQNGTSNSLYVGTDIGVYFRDVSMTEWVHFSNGLPSVVVSELEIQYNVNKIRAATFGRGLWESPLFEQQGIPQALIGYSVNNACEGVVNFFSQSTGIPDIYNWDFNDGATSTLQNPVHQYSSFGDYNVRLIVSNPLGIDTVNTIVHFVADTITASFTSSSNLACSFPTSVSFINQSQNASSYLWDFGDGSFSTLTNPSHTYLTNGVFDVKLSAFSSLCPVDSITQNNFVNISTNNQASAIMPTTGTGILQNCCSGYLYDSGGENYYTDNTFSTITITVPNATSIHLTFEEFDFEAGPNNTCDYDYLAVYDGNNTASLIGLYCNNNIPTSITSSTGSVTFEQFSDPGVNGAGFKVLWNCSGVSVNTLNNNQNISVFPNPNNGNFILKSSTNNIDDIEIFNSMGISIYKNNIAGKLISTIPLHIDMSGIYLIRTKVKNNFYLNKITIQK